jgi:hypothetical protein
VEKKTKIIISASALILVSAAWYLLWYKKRNKISATKIVEIPKKHQDNPLIVSTKNKIDYIVGTLDTMQLKKGVIVSKSGSPYDVGLLQGVWRIHNNQIDELKRKVDVSTQPKEVKDIAYEMIKNVSDSNVSIFNPKEYSYEAQWYKDYLKK